MTASLAPLIETSLGAVCHLVTDGTHDTPKRVDTGYPLIKAKEITGGRIDFMTCDQISEIDHRAVISRSKPEFGDTLFAHIGASLGECAFVNTTREFSIKNVALFKPNPAIIDSRYLYYLVTSPAFQALAKGTKTGSAQPFIGLGQLRSHSIIFHDSLPIQRRIASILSAYDDLIENHRKRIAILEEMARRLYREWFVHFRYPGHEAVPLVDSPLGRIPQGWEAGKLGKVVNLRWGDTNTTKASYVASGFDAYSASGLDGKLDHFDFDRVGIVLSAIGANCGTTWLARGKWSCIKNTIRYWPIDPRIGIEYLFLVTQGTAYWTRRGAAQPFISQSDAHEAPILIPSIDISSAFSAQAAPLFEMMANLHQQISILRRTRDLLLPRLMSGTLSVEALATAEAAVP